MMRTVPFDIPDLPSFVSAHARRPPRSESRAAYLPPGRAALRESNPRTNDKVLKTLRLKQTARAVDTRDRHTQVCRHTCDVCFCGGRSARDAARARPRSPRVAEDGSAPRADARVRAAARGTGALPSDRAQARAAGARCGARSPPGRGRVRGDVGARLLDVLFPRRASEGRGWLDAHRSQLAQRH